MHERFRSLPFFLALGLVLFAASLTVTAAWATTVAPPADLGHLTRMSDAVVFAQAIESRVDEDSDLPYTVTRFLTLEPVAGADPGLIFEVRELGGAGRVRAAAVAGAPRYQDGRNYLLFLAEAPEGRWQSRMMAYGLLEEAGGLLRPLPEAGNVEVFTNKSYEPVGVYRRDGLLQHLRDVAQGAAWNGRQAAASPSESLLVGIAETGAGLAAPAGCQFMTHQTDGLPIRWFGYETGATSQVMATTPGQTGISDGGVSAVQAGSAVWTTHPDALMRFNFGGTRARSITCSGNFDLDNGGVVFNDPCGDIADLSGCAGTLAVGGPFFELTTRLYDGMPWHAATSVFSVVNNGAQCVGEINFREVLGHELGHTQGFGHHTPPALMAATLGGGNVGAVLRPTDKVCTNFAYHTFLDVPSSRWSWRYIEAIENARIDTGCGSGNYCPASLVNRASLAVFLVRGEHGGTYVPPAATGTVFSDVPASHPQAAFIEQLFRDGLTGGCATNPLRYCPSSNVSRAEMATFLIRIGHGPTYTPPPATGTAFQDVPASYWAAPFIEQLFREGGTAGCSTTPSLYCPETLLTREEIATFLARAYSLPLP